MLFIGNAVAIDEPIINFLKLTSNVAVGTIYLMYLKQTWNVAYQGLYEIREAFIHISKNYFNSVFIADLEEYFFTRHVVIMQSAYHNRLN